MNDDMGASDIGCHVGEVQTAHLDRLFTNGVRFTPSQHTAWCCPRASILTGLRPHPVGVSWMTTDVDEYGYCHTALAGGSPPVGNTGTDGAIETVLTPAIPYAPWRASTPARSNWTRTGGEALETPTG